jgi:L-rhamnose 1-dehydrogenase
MDRTEVGRFAGRVALVTGATSGIGQATAIRLARDGAVVAVNQRPGGDPTETLEAIEREGGQAFPVIADMRDPAQVLAMVNSTAQIGGRLDYVVGNAAINPLLAWDATTLEDWDAIQETNLRGTWVVCQAGAKQMIAEGHGGAIVTVSSISAYVGAAEQVAYCASKAGILMLTKALAVVLGPHGIRCNSVLPGPVSTKMSSSLLVEGTPERQFYVEKTPLHRIADPVEIANVIAFLLSDEATYMNSSEVLIDGGFIVNAE